MPKGFGFEKVRKYFIESRPLNEDSVKVRHQNMKKCLSFFKQFVSFAGSLFYLMAVPEILQTFDIIFLRFKNNCNDTVLSKNAEDVEMKLLNSHMMLS